jgi:ribose transport system ATP-binding protein
MNQLQLRHISKTFPGVKALWDVTLSFRAGEIHALCGENGAGKSTLMNILAGNLTPDEGIILVDDFAQKLNNPKDAMAIGISIVYQHLSLVDGLNVAENIFANDQPVNAFGIIQFEELYQKTSLLLQQLKLKDINPHTLVSSLSPAQKQMVEIAKALSKKPSILILDEPTASLTEKETCTLFEILHTLKNEGVAILYISHRLDEIFLLADSISILKDGKHHGTFAKQNLTKSALIKLMVGREINTLKSASHRQSKILLSVKNLTGSKFQNISFNLHKGEILGIAGLVGAGRTEIAKAIFGADKIRSGDLMLNDAVLKPKHPFDAISKGIAYIPEERKSLGLFSEMSVKANIVVTQNTLANTFYNSKEATNNATELKEKLKIVTPNIQQRVFNLSGGNQQKVVLAKWLLTNPEVCIVDEPTHGIDVGAKFEIYELLKSLAAKGKGIVMISSDMPELIGLCDRILVIKKGMLAGEVSDAEATEEKILTLAAD